MSPLGACTPVGDMRGCRFPCPGPRNPLPPGVRPEGDDHRRVVATHGTCTGPSCPWRRPRWRTEAGGHSHAPSPRHQQPPPTWHGPQVLKKEHAILNTARRKLKGEGAKNEGAKKEAKLLEAGRRESERAREVAREKRALRRARECGDLGDTCVLAALPSRRRETVATTIAEVCETRGHGVSKTEVGLCPNPFPTPFPITSEGGGRKGKRVIKSHPDVAQRHGPDLKPNLNDMTNLWRRLTARC